MAAAVQLSVRGRGISNLWVKSWARTLPAFPCFSEGWNSVHQTLCERMGLVLHPGDVEGSHLSKGMAAALFQPGKRHFLVSELQRIQVELLKLQVDF